ncbi:MAG: hypothetical protein ABSF87_10065 [Xanthobacteraceae bacterium]
MVLWFSPVSQTYVSAIHILRAVHLFQQKAYHSSEAFTARAAVPAAWRSSPPCARPCPWVKRSPKAIRRGSFLAGLFSTGEELERRANGHDLNGTDADLAKGVQQPVVM